MIRDWLFMGGIAFASVSIVQMGLQTVNAKADGALVDNYESFSCAASPLGLSARTSALVFGDARLQYSTFAGELETGTNAIVQHSRFGTSLVTSELDERSLESMIDSDAKHSNPSPGLQGVMKALDKFNVRGGTGVSPAAGEREDLFFSGSSSLINVFSMSSVSLEKARTLSIEGLPGSTTLVIVNGDEVSLKATAMRLQGISAEGIIFYFPTAKRITVSSMNFKGTVLAPNAVFESSEVVLAGQVVVRELHGRLDIRQSAFKGCIPSGI